MDQSSCHIQRNNPPKQFCERCFEQGDQKSHQNELELVLELDGDLFGRKKCVDAGISGGEPPWAHEAGGAPRGWAHHGPSWPGACSPCYALSARYSQIFKKKSYLNFRSFGELLFSGYFYIAWIIRKQTEITIFSLFNINNRK